MASNKKSNNAFRDIFHALDIFGTGFQMKLDNGILEQKSYMGSCLTIFCVLATLMFTYTKVVTLSEKSEVDIMSALFDGAIDYSEKFTAEDGFFIAASLTDYDNNLESIEEPKYGELIIEHYGWGYGDGVKSEARALDYHPCSDEELGFNRTENTLLYPVRESSLGEVKTYRKKFKCVNKQDL